MIRVQASGVWSRLAGLKRLVLEPRNAGAGDFDDAMRAHKAAIAAGSGSLLLAVCRGKVTSRRRRRWLPHLTRTGVRPPSRLVLP